MTFSEHLEALERLHRLIKLKATGTPTQLAERFNVSQRTMRNLIQDLRDREVSVIAIHYCRIQQTYYYEREVDIVFCQVKAARWK
jgi:DNA-binding transcriptional regulator LsrR (DeoR family)